MSTVTRRSLFAATTLAAVNREATYGYPANDTIRLGVIGTGGRARQLMQALDSVPGVRIAALADVWEGALAEAAKLAPADAVKTKHYHELLDRKDIEAVIIGSPDHWPCADDGRRVCRG